MAPEERVAEIASLMAQAILRLKSKKARKSKAESTISLDSLPNQSVCVRETSKTGK